MQLKIDRPDPLSYAGQATGAVAGSVIGLVVLIAGLFFVINTAEKHRPIEPNINQEENQLKLRDDINFGSGDNAPASDSIQGENNTMNQDLKIETIKDGEGEETVTGNTLSVQYTGWLEDGTKFDSSYDRNQPFVFTLGQGQVIAGWDQGLLGMKIGEKRKLTIPPSLAYSDKEIGSIPAGSTLIFEVELVKIE